MEAVSSLQFAAAARTVAAVCRSLGVAAPGFRSPPKQAGLDRSLRRRPGGSAIVAVRLGDRPIVAVLADMVEGTVAANRLAGAEASRCRAALWEALAGEAPVAQRARVAEVA